MHSQRLLMQISCLLFLPFAIGVKIGVSKMGTTTTTTTLAPNLIETTTNNPALVEDISATETSIISTTSIRPTTVALEFPPKKHTTTKPKTTTTTATTTLAATTTISVLTTIENNVENDSVTVLTSPGHTHFYCSCNLMPSSCDINCCCDPDCTKDALKVFNCFLPSKYPELRVRLEDFQYEHGLPSCKINDGWLCVFRTNTRPPATKAISYNFDTKDNFKWPSSLTEIDEVEQRTIRDFYKFGDPISLVDETTWEIRNFELPYAFKPPYCKLMEPIRYLISAERRCLVTSLATTKNVEQELQFLKDTNKLLSRPKSQITEAEDLKDHMVQFQVKTFLQTLENKMDDYVDINIASNETEIEVMQQQQQTYIKEIDIKVMHNFTDLLNCQIEVKIQEISDEEAQETVELWQKYSVQFIAINATDKEQSTEQTLNANQFKYSGPLGYLQGEPIIVGKYVVNNESEEMSTQNRVLDFFKEPLLKHNTFRMFGREHGFCQRSIEKSFSVSYGISSLYQCQFQMSNNLFKSIKNTNATGICLKLQKEILLQLFERSNVEDLTELFISMLGHPQNTTEKWLQLQLQNLDFAPVVGELTAESPKTLVCRNILLSAAYEFHIGKFIEQGVAHQALVKHAVLKLGQRHDLEFTMDEQLEVPLTLTVMFYDLALNNGFSSVQMRIECFGFMLFMFWFKFL